MEIVAASISIHSENSQENSVQKIDWEQNVKENKWAQKEADCLRLKMLNNEELNLYSAPIILGN